ncbi:MAG: rraA [Devosia sp.]|uniref:ribonuclease E activity regulator RraA n=1 Tax=Devosia sp. TaxID=1871048 RepID=UPI00262E1DDA|nr:ribonuclease E activity regulator RraA [Devosia sp.]MDB5585356.1 rraA [Devosia sp.]
MHQPAIVTADIYDVHHAALQVCELQFRSFGANASFFGPCVTLATFEDHTPVLAALQQTGNGRVLVVDGQGSLRIGLMGDRLAKFGADNGWAGVVMNGVIRDSLGMEDLDIGVKALGTTARRGWVPIVPTNDIALTIGGATFNLGDWVYADVDSVIVSRTELDLTISPAAPLSYPDPQQ